jgi:hypothetical protein
MVLRLAGGAGEAKDAAAVERLNAPMTMPDGYFSNSLRTEVFSPLSLDHVEFGYCAPGVGLVLELNPVSGARTELVRVTVDWPLRPMRPPESTRRLPPHPSTRGWLGRATQPGRRRTETVDALLDSARIRHGNARRALGSSHVDRRGARGGVCSFAELARDVAVRIGARR